MSGEMYPSGKKITVLGAGISGLSLAHLAAKLRADVFLSEAKGIAAETAEKLASEGIKFESGGHTPKALDCDLAIASSGFPPSAEIVKIFRERGIPLLGELDFVRPLLHGRLIGVTGSNGKTTTASLAGYLLESAGFRVAIAGNIGNPIADIAGSEFDYIVAELSSFQLHWSSRFTLDVAVVTNLAPDHIDWHGSYKKYAEAKARIFSSVAGNGFSILREIDSDALGVQKEGTFVLAWNKSSNSGAILLDGKAGNARLCRRRTEDSEKTETHLFNFTDTKLLGKHNMENAAMAMSALCLSGVSPSSVLPYLGAYVPPPHRCAFVAEIGGVSYVDDSKGTNVAAAETALSSLPGKKIVILGGRGKGEDYGRLKAALTENARGAVLLGEAAAEIADSLGENGYTDFKIVKNMEEAVEYAAKIALPGDVVLLSPACTSWDMYRHYGERGDHFASLVRLMERQKS